MFDPEKVERRTATEGCGLVIEKDGALDCIEDGEWVAASDYDQLLAGFLALERIYEKLLDGSKWAMREMCATISPRDSFTDAVDALDAAITPSSTSEP